MRKNLIIAGLVLAALVFFIVGFFLEDDRKVGLGVEYSPPNGPAILVQSEELYKALSDSVKFELLRVDLGYFGRNTIEKYKSGELKDVIFEIKSEIETNGNQLSFEGKFKDSKDTVSVKVDKLKNSRIKVVLVNTKTKASFDDKLPSNSVRNQFAAKLPIIKESYIIDFSSHSEAFVVTLYEGESSKKLAEQEIMAALGVTDLKEENIGYITPGAFENSQNLSPSSIDPNNGGH